MWLVESACKYMLASSSRRARAFSTVSERERILWVTHFFSEQKKIVFSSFLICKYAYKFILFALRFIGVLCIPAFFKYIGEWGPSSVH